MKSILQNEYECYLCRKLYGLHVSGNLEEHHVIFGNGNRRVADRQGLTVYLCVEHHRTGRMAVHNNREVAELVMMDGQRKFEESHTREEWRALFGKSWL